MHGILTYHDGYNYGTFLQVYALQKKLNSMGIENEIINYKSLRHLLNEYKCLLYTKNPNLLIANIQKAIAFKKAHKQLKMTSFFTDIKKAPQKKYNSIIFGSDEIWNYTNPVVGLDLPYFGYGLKADKFIAYAVSLGSLGKDVNMPPIISKYLQQFAAISVRDENSYSILSRYYRKSIKMVLDPTLIYDFDSEVIDCPYDNFILVYGAGFDSITQEKIKEYAQKRGKKLISVGYLNKFCDQNEIAISPFEFLGYYKKAYEVITSMFHGVLMSIKFEKQFVIVVDPYRINKLETIINKLMLKERIVKEDNLEKSMSKTINYENIKMIIRQERIESERFLNTAIEK
jgi:polysaccharide pyruvyl transferase WcaK-like protein